MRLVRSAAVAVVCGVLFTGALTAQADADRALEVVRLEAVPATIVVTQGETTTFSVRALDAAGEVVEVAIRVAGARRGLRITGDEVFGVAAGDYQIFVSVPLPADAGRQPVVLRVPVTVEWPTPSRIDIASSHASLVVGTSTRLSATVHHADGTTRPDAQITWASSDPETATVDRFGYVSALDEGSVQISATFEGVAERMDIAVAPFPAVSLEITGGAEDIRTGDVQTFGVDARAANGSPLDGLPVAWTLAFQPAAGIIAPAAPGQLDGGRMVADVPGVYTVMATAGPLVATRRFNVTQRDVIQKLDVVGHGRQTTHYTSDLWVFEGVDGRDYALTGARQAQSHAFVWDVTDPANIFKTDSIQVDARSLNDVKVSPDSRYAVISREGASNRRNGLVVLDLSIPAHPTIASIYDDGLTGGVHNVFLTNENIFALSAGDKYVILDATDIRNPTYVSEYDHPNSRIHDVWVHDGIAYSAEWENGIVMVDVGNGRWGGSIDNPQLITSYKLPSDATHAIFPYVSQSTGKLLLFVGDEIVNRNGLAWEGNGPDHRQQYDPATGRGGYPRATSGYIQILDLSEPEQPKMIARYEVSEYGTHNMWVEDDILYQAYYEGGIRLVDVSGELMGNLYTQGREIAVFKANDPLGWIPNSPAAWGAMPHKGHIFFSDISSGLWAVKLEPREKPIA